jgi:catechol 2,3-dioxygenase-like lactoylglutathione lyase family enzyme
LEVFSMSTQASSDSAAGAAPTATAALRLEVVIVPVSDVDRAKAFYLGLGWRLDADFTIADDYRIVQITPPQSPASIQFGVGVSGDLPPGSVKNMYLVVDDVGAAREELLSLGAPVSEVWHGRGPNPDGHEPGPAPDHTSYGSFASFADPDGNTYLLQEIGERLPGREW